MVSFLKEKNKMDIDEKECQKIIKKLSSEIYELADRFLYEECGNKEIEAGHMFALILFSHINSALSLIYKMAICLDEQQNETCFVMDADEIKNNLMDVMNKLPFVKNGSVHFNKKWEH